MEKPIPRPPYICIYCNREYKIFDNFKKHNICCEFFHKTRKERCNQTECFENLPSQRDMFRIIQDLAIRCERLENEVRSLKGTVSTKRRKEIVEYLNHIAVPNTTFKEWVSKQTIEFQHLECVFEYNLTEGIKLCIQESLEQSVHISSKHKYENIPIAAFEQKPNIFYIYDCSGQISPQWKRMDNEIFERWITTLSHRFLQYFIEWQSDNLDKLTSEKDKEDNIMYMIKVNGGRNPQQESEKRITELRKWLFTKIHIHCSSMIEIV
jgi:hypothetical protein